MRDGKSSVLMAFGVVAILVAGASTASAQGSVLSLKSSAFDTTAAAAAANSGQEGFGVQVLGGFVFPNITDASGFDTSAKTGWLIGLGLGGNRGGRVGVEADILYGERTTEIHTLLGSADFKQHVVDVPVMLKGNIGSTSASGASVFVQGGGFFDWLFNSKIGNVDISEDTDGFEVGLVFGGGVEFARVSVQGRFYRGLRAIDRTFNVGSSVESKSQGFVFLVGFRAN